MNSAAVKPVTFGKLSAEAASRLRAHDHKPSLSGNTSQVKSNAKPYSVRQTVDKREKSEHVRYTRPTKTNQKKESQVQATRKSTASPPPLASRARRVSSAAPQSKPMLSSTTKPLVPARPVSPHTRRVSSVNLQSRRSLSVARGPKGSERSTTKSSLPPRHASLHATQQIRRNLKEMRRPSIEEPPLAQIKARRRSQIPVIRSTVPRPSSRLGAPIKSQEKEKMVCSQVLLEKLPVQDWSTSYRVEELGSHSNRLVVLTPLRNKTEAMAPDEGEKGRSTPVSRFLRSDSRASSEQKIGEPEEIPSQREMGSSDRSMHVRREGSGRKRLLEKLVDVTPSSFQRDRDVTFETEARPTLKRQRFMVTLPFHLEESLHDTDNTQFFTPDKVLRRSVTPEREEERMDEASEEAMTSVPYEDQSEEVEETHKTELNILPYYHHSGEIKKAEEHAQDSMPCEKEDAEQIPSGWRCILM